MIERKNVQSSSIEFEPLVIDVDTVYKNFNESKIFDEETKEHIGWEYDQIQYDKNEYIGLISKENEILKLELGTSTMEMLNTITLLNQESQVHQAQLLMEVTKMIEEMGGVN